MSPVFRQHELMALDAWALALDLPVTICVILRKSLNLSGPQLQLSEKGGWTQWSLNHLDCIKQTGYLKQKRTESERYHLAQRTLEV